MTGWRTLRAVISRLRASLSSRRREIDLSDEIQSHLDQLAAGYIARGMTPGEALLAARREFGGVDQMKEIYRDQRSLPVIEWLAQDVRYGLRTLGKNRGFTIVAVLTLALGLGTNTAIFSLLDAVVMKSLPIERPAELFVLKKSGPNPGPQRFSYPAFQDFQQAAPAPQHVAAMSRIARWNTLIAGSRESEIALGQLVSGRYFSTLGVRAASGRVIGPEDERTLGGHPVAVLSHGFWQRRFGGSEAALGQTIRLNGASFTIIGVAARGFSGVWTDAPVDVWLPLVMQHVVRYAQNYSNTTGRPGDPWIPQEAVSWLDVVGRAGPEQRPRVAAAFNAVFRQSLEQSAPRIEDAQQRRLFLMQFLALESFGRGFSSLRQQFAAPLGVLMGMVGLVLLIACANLANLLLARGAARQREIAVRLSLGAGRARVMHQLLVESLLLSAVGGAAGLAVAHWTNAFLVRMAVADTGPMPPAFGLDLRVFAFAVVLSLITGLLFGVVPAYRATQVSLNTALKTTSRTTVGRSGEAGMRPLVAAQVALSLVLVVGAGLFGRSLVNLSRQDPGFDRQHLLAVSISPRLAGYSVDQLPVLYGRLIAGVEAIPGVQSASLSMCGLASDCRSFDGGFEISGYQRRAGEEISLLVNRVSPRYFTTVGIGVVEGREFDEHDTEKSTPVVILNEAAARRYFAGRSPLGQRLGIPQPDTQVVGVVRDARVLNPHTAPEPMAYFPIRQPVTFASALDVRAAADPQRMGVDVRKAVAGVDPNLPIARVVPMFDQIDGRLRQDRLVAYLTSAFGMLALALACIGLYGVMSYGVASRTPELGVRLALGASRSQILGLVLRESLVCVGLGVAAGLVLLIGASRLVAGLLFGLTSNDPTTIGLATLLLICCAALAGYLPARRASQLDPMAALRHE